MVTNLNRPAGFSGREILDLLIEFAYSVAVFFVPLYFALPWFPTYNVFELNKLVLFAVLFWLLLFLTLLKIIFYWPFTPFAAWSRAAIWSALKKYWLMPAIFIVGLAVSLFFSLDRAQSFYGSYQHQSGLVSYLFYFAWFILLSFNLLSVNNAGGRGVIDSPEKRIRRLVVTAAMAGFIVSLYGILQIFNLDFLTWTEPPYLTHRTISTFGQPNFLASFLLFIIPLDIYLVFQSTRLKFRLIYVLFSLASLLCLFFTASRGAFVALVLVALLFLLYSRRRIRLDRKRKLALLGGFAALVIIFLVGWNYLVPGRLVESFNLLAGSVAARLQFYGAAVQAISLKPFFGYGLENSGEAFIRYYTPDWGLYSSVGTSTDRAHNLILDILLSAGVWGLLFFAGLYHYVWRLLSQAAGVKKNQALVFALGVGVVGYLLSLLFSFSLVAGEIYFWFFLSLLVALNLSASLPGSSQPLPVPEPAPLAKVSVLKAFLVVLTTVFVAWQIIISAQILIGDHYFFKLYQTLDERRFFTALVLKEYVNQTGPDPVRRDYYNIFWGEKLSELLPAFFEKSVQVVARQELIEAGGALPERGFNNWLAKGRIASSLGDYPQALRSFQQVEALAPAWPVVYLEEGKMFLAQGEEFEAIKAYRRALDCLPDIDGFNLAERHARAYQFYFYSLNRGLGDAYSRLGQTALAEKYYQTAEASKELGR